MVDVSTADDAGVFRLQRDLALVQTVDFFTPIVDDPFTYGQIAAANALSDVYAMGGRPLTALNILGVPTEVVSPAVIADILRGGAAKMREAKCVIVGGHSIRNPEPIYGLSVTGLVSPRRMMTNSAARPGDVLLLTKPLGTGIITTALKRGICPAPLARRAIRSMQRLNDAGFTLATRGLVRAGTDITGFGLLGHLSALCDASGVSAEVDANALPTFAPAVLDLIDRDCVPGGTRANLDAVKAHTESKGVSRTLQLLAADAQTSGGLLLCVPQKHLSRVLRTLESTRVPSIAVLGRITRPAAARIRLFA